MKPKLNSRVWNSRGLKGGIKHAYKPYDKQLNTLDETLRVLHEDYPKQPNSVLLALFISDLRKVRE